MYSSRAAFVCLGGDKLSHIPVFACTIDMHVHVSLDSLLTAEVLKGKHMSCKERVWVGLSHCCRLAARTSDTQMPSAQSSQNLLGTFMSPHLSLYLVIKRSAQHGCAKLGLTNRLHEYA